MITREEDSDYQSSMCKKTKVAVEKDWQMIILVYEFILIVLHVRNYFAITVW